MDDIIRIVKSLEHSGVLIGGVSETVKHEMKYKKVDFLACYWKRLTGKGIVSAGTMSWITWVKFFCLLHPLCNIEITKYFN